MGSPRTLAADALLDLLFPFWHAVIAALVLITVVISVNRLIRRGPTRMGGAMLLAGAAVVGLTVIGWLAQML